MLSLRDCYVVHDTHLQTRCSDSREQLGMKYIYIYIPVYKSWRHNKYFRSTWGCVLTLFVAIYSHSLSIIYPFIQLSIYLFFHLSIGPFVFHESIHPLIFSSIHPSIFSSLHISIHPSIYLPSIFSSPRISTYPYFHPFICPSIYFFVCLAYWSQFSPTL